MEPELLFMIIAADPLVRAGLAAHIETQSNCEVVGLASPFELLTDENGILKERGANIIIWDWGLENSDSAAVDFSEVVIPIVLLLSDNLELEELWATGAKAMIKRDASGAEIYATALAVSCGKIVIDPEFAQDIFPGQPQKPDDLRELPTQREQQVLQLMAEGFTNNAIANQLGISKHTVKFHINSIFGKLNAQSRTEAVVQATRLGLISL